MERETELTQSWNPELSALSDTTNGGGLLKGIPLQIAGEMRTFSLPMPQDDDGTDISLKDWQLGPRDASTSPPFSIKPFKGSVRTRFTPMEPRLDEDLTSPRGGGQSSPDHFETPTTTPRMSSSGTHSSSVSPSQSGDTAADNEVFHHTVTHNGIAFDIPAKDESQQDDASLRARSLRVSFKDNSRGLHHRNAAPVVRHRSPLKSRSLHPAKEVKSLQPKWESSTKIRPERTSSGGSYGSKTTVQAPLHGMKARKGGKPAAKRARGVVVPVVTSTAPGAAPEISIELEGPPEVQGSSGYLSERYSGGDFRRSLDSSQSLGRDHLDSGADEYGSTGLSRELTMSPVHRTGRKDFGSGRSGGSPSLRRSNGGHRHGVDADVSDAEEDQMKGGMLCGGGLSDTKLSGDFVRLLSKLCRVSVPKQQPPLSKSVSLPANSRGRSRSSATSQSWDPATQNGTREGTNKMAFIGRHDSLKLLSEKCSNAPAPSYTVHKPRKIRTHEPHQHFYRTISKTLDQKLRS